MAFNQKARPESREERRMAKLDSPRKSVWRSGLIAGLIIGFIAGNIVPIVLALFLDGGQ